MRKTAAIVGIGIVLMSGVAGKAWQSSMAPHTAQIANGAESLPLKIMPATNPDGKPLVVIATGDGGWADMDIQMSRDFNADNMSVVGIDSLRYFWQPKTPEQASRDLDHLLTQYEGVWHPSRIILVGFSKGAQVFPFMVDRLPMAQQKEINDIVLLSPRKDVSFGFHFTDWLEPYIGSKVVGKIKNTLPLVPEVDKLTDSKVLCFYGVQDHKAGRICNALDAQRFTIVAMPGKHHFDEDYKTLVQKILQDAHV